MFDKLSASSQPLSAASQPTLPPWKQVQLPPQAVPARQALGMYLDRASVSTATGSLGSHGPGSSDDNRNTRRTPCTTSCTPQRCCAWCCWSDQYHASDPQRILVHAAVPALVISLSTDATMLRVSCFGLRAYVPPKLLEQRSAILLFCRHRCVWPCVSWSVDTSRRKDACFIDRSACLVEPRTCDWHS